MKKIERLFERAKVLYLIWFFLSCGINQLFSGWRPQKNHGLQNLKFFLGFKTDPDFRMQIKRPNVTSHSAYVATSTKLDRVKIDGFKIQILFRFQKCKGKVPSLSLLKKCCCFSKPTLGDQNLKKNFFFGGTVDELFAYSFGIYIKFGFKNLLS